MSSRNDIVRHIERRSVIPRKLWSSIHFNCTMEFREKALQNFAMHIVVFRRMWRWPTTTWVGIVGSFMLRLRFHHDFRQLSDILADSHQLAFVAQECICDELGFNLGRVASLLLRLESSISCVRQYRDQMHC